MIARLLRAAVSFVVVLATYWAYSLLAVPWIEPPAIVREKTEMATPQAFDPSTRYRELFAAYFPPGHWVYDRPKVLANDQTMLLIKDYKPLPGGRVDLTPCVILYFPEPQPNQFKPQRQAVILDAPQGAILQFENGFNLSQAKIGKLIHGELRGEINIRSDMSQPGPEDDLVVRTREIQISDSRIYTEHDVSFRVGENHGHGSQMELRLMQGDGAANSPGMSISGIQSMELTRNVKMNLAMGGAKLLPDDRKKQPSTPGAPPEDSKQPMEVTCRGPFIFDLIGYVATFEDHVDVLRTNPDGPGDQMTCERLAVHFMPRTPEKPKSKKGTVAEKKPAGGMRSLKPTMIEARGEPVIVRSPSNGGHARCQRLKYDLLTRTIELDGSEEITLLQGANEIHAPAVHYQPSEQPGGLGALWASGPGWLRAASDKNPGQIFEARWGEELHLRKHEGLHVISIRGRPDLGQQGMGRLLADEVHLWLREKPVAAEGQGPVAAASPDGAAQPEKGQKVEPDRMLATGKVQISSPQMTGAADRLEAWFKPSLTIETTPPIAENGAIPPAAVLPQTLAPVPAAAPPALPTAPRESIPARSISNPANTPQPAAAPADTLQPVLPVRTARRPVGEVAAATSATPGVVTADSAVPAAEVAPKSFYDLRGKMIRLQVTMIGGTKAELADATVEGDVRLRETQTAKPDDKPLAIDGDRLQLTAADRPTTHVTVNGKPALVMARGLTMQGDAIELDRGENRLWIDGPGTMTLPAQRDLRGTPQAEEQTLTIEWQGAMNFDGKLAEFRKHVIGRATGQYLKTETLAVEVKNKVLFSAAKPSDRAEVETIACRDGVYMENHTLEAGRVTAIDRMEMRDLAVNQLTGEIFGNGPGWITSVRLGSAAPGGKDILARPGAAPPAKPAAKSPEKPDEEAAEEIQFLRVDFRRAMQGNTLQRQIHFHNEVRAVHGPVPTWESTLSHTDIDRLGDKGVSLQCDRLVLNEIKPVAEARGTLELEALGNTVIEGNTFTARADRMAYAQAKELFVLEGTGTGDAQIWRQTQVGGAPTHAAARKILYWRASDRVEINDARYFGGAFSGSAKDNGPLPPDPSRPAPKAK